MYALQNVFGESMVIVNPIRSSRYAVKYSLADAHVRAPGRPHGSSLNRISRSPAEVKLLAARRYSFIFK